MPSFTHRLVTVRLYAIDSDGQYWIANCGNTFASPAPVELVKFWDESRVYLEESFGTLARKATIHTIVTSIEFEPPMDPVTRAQPMPKIWRIDNRDLVIRWFGEYLFELFAVSPLTSGNGCEESARDSANTLPSTILDALGAPIRHEN
jgi:hypothetical protein